jgi:lipopolysaccharide heptosyltransferase I
VTLRSRQFERILLIKPSAVGDVIHTVPVLARLRERYPRARIDWLLTPAIAELMGRHSALSNAVLFDRHTFSRFGRSWGATKGLFDLMSALRRTRYDLVIDLQGQMRSAILTMASGAPVRIGFDRPRAGVDKSTCQRLGKQTLPHGWKGAREGAWISYTHRIPIPTLDVHAVDRYLWVSRLLGLRFGPPDFRIPVPSAATERIAGLLRKNGLENRPLAVLVPGTVWETKHWRVNGFADVARYLLSTGWSVALAGSAKEHLRCQAVAAVCPGVRDLSGQTTLSELAALLQMSSMCVSNDSGSMHLAVALGTPVVSIFGPTDPVWVGPYGHPEAVLQASLACAPCYLRKLRGCPHDHRCMNEVTSAMVIERVRQTIASRGVAFPRAS